MTFLFEIPDSGTVIDADAHRCHKANYPHKRDAATARNFRLKGMRLCRDGWKHEKRHTPDHLREYYCEECGAWHLTHKG